MIDRCAWTACVVTGFLVASGVTDTATLRADEPSVQRPVTDWPEVESLPDPFVFLDGSTVKAPADWERRRGELKRLFEESEYGHLPPRPESIAVARGDITAGPVERSFRQDWAITLGQGGQTLVLHARLIGPKEATGRLPVVVRPGMFRPAGAGGAENTPPPASKANPGPARVSDAPVYLDRGIALLEFNLGEVAADNKDRFRSSGIFTLLGDQLDAGGLMAWAWGFHRMVDAIATDERLDPKRVIVTGHSRYGKAALVAGAFDDRIALTAPNHSGAGGAAPYRFLYGKSEALHNIVGAFPFWFRADFGQFVGQVKRLPVDQHELRALVAPRAVLVTEGTNDAWSNPEGSQLAHQAALRVYTFLGVPDRIAIRFRPVGHIVSSEDVADYADHLFAGKPLGDEFNKLPYPTDPKGMTWDAPPTPQPPTAKPSK